MQVMDTSSRSRRCELRQHLDLRLQLHHLPCLDGERRNHQRRLGHCDPGEIFKSFQSRARGFGKYYKAQSDVCRSCPQPTLWPEEAVTGESTRPQKSQEIIDLGESADELAAGDARHDAPIQTYADVLRTAATMPRSEVTLPPVAGGDTGRISRGTASLQEPTRPPPLTQVRRSMSIVTRPLVPKVWREVPPGVYLIGSKGACAQARHQDRIGSVRLSSE